ncbi:MAG TPA: homocysteine S-methyltransferase family protein [Dongiaceae bacterium]|nr:homocysteine S-methyltransferase family protein [Dongiaceae bacterium]
MQTTSRLLPQLDGRLFLSDGGIETSLIFLEGIELPHFAAFDLLRDPSGRAVLHKYYARYARIARDGKMGFVLESPTWRSSPDWGAKLGYSEADLDVINRAAIKLMLELRAEYATPDSPMVVSGCVGPRGDGYDPGQVMTREEAALYHAPQIASMTAAGAEMISAITMTNVPEAIGIARAAREVSLPSVISFTVETDGMLPTGQTLGQAITQVDAATDQSPACYMINCAHPTHFADMLDAAERAGESWVKRVRGLRANASRRSHQELNESPDLDAGNPAELGQEYAALRRRHPQINVLGGCCGTDHRHLEQIGHCCNTHAKAA